MHSTLHRTLLTTRCTSNLHTTHDAMSYSACCTSHSAGCCLLALTRTLNTLLPPPPSPLALVFVFVFDFHVLEQQQWDAGCFRLCITSTCTSAGSMQRGSSKAPHSTPLFPRETLATSLLDSMPSVRLFHACMCACARVCVCVCVRACVHALATMCSRARHCCSPCSLPHIMFCARLPAGMGLPLGKLVVATNKNDILYRFLRHRDYSAKPVQPSLGVCVCECVCECVCV